jgi:predicted  nucleic acid-binding Zn-ribbon protein
MAQQTAINWLRKKLEETYDKEGKLPIAYTFSLLNKAEQIENEHKKALEDKIENLEAEIWELANQS